MLMSTSAIINGVKTKTQACDRTTSSSKTQVVMHGVRLFTMDSAALGLAPSSKTLLEK
jgi:hypothetical protein